MIAMKWPQRVCMLSVSFGVLSSGACGAPIDARSRISFALPERLQCANPVVDIKAELWVSGMGKACEELSVDSQGQVSGTCKDKVTARIDRIGTLDYFVEQTTQNVGPFRLLLAQARKTLPLKSPTTDVVKIEFSDSDFVSNADCRDMTHIDDDTGEGAASIDDFVIGASPCDVDDDGNSNLAEVCDNANPYDPN